MIKKYQCKNTAIKAVLLEETKESIISVIELVLNHKEEIDKNYEKTLFEIISSSKSLTFEHNGNLLKAFLGDYIVRGVDSRIHIWV